MTTDEQAIEKIVLTELLRLNATIVGLLSGLLLGGGVFATTNILLLKGGTDVGAHLWLLSQFFIGYQVSFLGSLIGLAYGFLTGFVIGYVFAWLYNLISNRRQGKAS